MAAGFHVLRRNPNDCTCSCHYLFLRKVQPIFQHTYFIPQRHFHVVRNSRRPDHPRTTKAVPECIKRQLLHP